MVSLKSVKDFLALEKSIMILSFLSFTFSAGYILWSTFLPKFYEGLGANVETIGLLFSLNVGIEAIVAIVAGWLTDKFGRKSVLIYSGFILIASYILYILSFNWFILFLPVIIFSVAYPLFNIPRRALAVDSLPKNKRATGYTMMWVLGGLPAILFTPVSGWLVGKYGAIGGVKIAFAVSIILILLGLIFVFRIKEKWKKQRGEGTFKIVSMWNFLKKMHLSAKYLTLGVGILFFGMWMIQPFTVIFATNILKISPFNFGILMTVFYGISYIIMAIGGKLSDRFGRKPLILMTFLFTTIGYGLIFFAQNIIHIIILLIIAAIGSIGQSSFTTLLADLTHKKSRGRVFGISDSLCLFATIPGPIIGGIIYTISPSMTSLVAGLIMFLSFLIVLKFVKEEQKSF